MHATRAVNGPMPKKTTLISRERGLILPRFLEFVRTGIIFILLVGGIC